MALHAPRNHRRENRLIRRTIGHRQLRPTLLERAVCFSDVVPRPDRLIKQRHRGDFVRVAHLRRHAHRHVRAWLLRLMFYLSRLRRRIRGKHGIRRRRCRDSRGAASVRRAQLGIDREIAAAQRGVKRVDRDDIFTRIQEFARIRDHDLLPHSLVVVRERVVSQRPAGDAHARDLFAVDPNHRAVVRVHSQRQPRRDLVRFHIEHAPQVHRRKLALHRDRRPVVSIAVADGCASIFPTVVLFETKRAPGGSRRGRLAGAFAIPPA